MQKRVTYISYDVKGGGKRRSGTTRGIISLEGGKWHPQPRHDIGRG